VPKYQRKESPRELTGVDIFVQARCAPEALATQLIQVTDAPLELKMISNRGVQVWPKGAPETFCTDHWRCRFIRKDHATDLHNRDLFKLAASLDEVDVDIVKTEHLYEFDGKPGYSMGQGQ
jgi:isocitrate dehydrogenase